MPRRMSCALTADAVRDRSKTVTRRHITAWTSLRPGDPLTLVLKAMGLRKGDTQQVLAQVRIVSVDEIPLWPITVDEVAAEGLPSLTPHGFRDFWLLSHGYRAGDNPTVRRIEWAYVE